MTSWTALVDDDIRRGCARVERTGSRSPWRRWCCVVDRPLGFDFPLVTYGATSHAARRRADSILGWGL